MSEWVSVSEGGGQRVRACRDLAVESATGSVKRTTAEDVAQRPKRATNCMANKQRNNNEREHGQAMGRSCSHIHREAADKRDRRDDGLYEKKRKKRGMAVAHAATPFTARPPRLLQLLQARR